MKSARKLARGAQLALCWVLNVIRHRGYVHLIFILHWLVFNISAYDTLFVNQGYKYTRNTLNYNYNLG